MSQNNSAKMDAAASSVALGKDKDLSRSYGTNWNSVTVNTLFEWLCIAAFKIACLELASDYSRKQIRNVTILGLVLSTLSGTVSVGTFSIPDESGVTQKVLSGIFTLLSFTIAVATGYLKVYQVQEHLEQYIKHKQDWVIFSTSVASELQLPIELRRDGMWVIIKNKSVYLDLLKTDLEMPAFVYKAATPRLPRLKEINRDVSSLSNIILDIGYQEFADMNAQSATANAANGSGSCEKASAILSNMLQQQQTRTGFRSLADNTRYQSSVMSEPRSIDLTDAPSSITLVVRGEDEDAESNGPNGPNGPKGHALVPALATRTTSMTSAGRKVLTLEAAAAAVAEANARLAMAQRLAAEAAEAASGTLTTTPPKAPLA